MSISKCSGYGGALIICKGLLRRYNMVSRGAWYCPLFAIDVKGGGKRQEEEYCKQRKSIAINDKGGDCWKYCH
jgi:hypothetical protein